MSEPSSTAPANLFDLEGRIAIVTGGSRGLGRAMVLGLARAGADVVIASRNLSNCESVAMEVKGLGRDALPCEFDAGRWSDCEELVEAAYSHFGHVDILVNNAGFAPPMPPLERTDEALFDQILNVNFKSPFRLATLIGSRMAASEGGSIINIVSAAAFVPEPATGVYGAAKAALTAMTRALSRAYAPKVRVNSLSPGPFDTDIWLPHLPPEGKEGLGPMPNALARMADPQEIVTSALYLASPASSFTTGGCLRVDGGYL
jgi:NAD(P)-dependent dehydrogenase (short-subunit alcohol dehydrogenase family)